jgi:hypothetical protein
LQIWPQTHDGETRFIARLLRRPNKEKKAGPNAEKKTGSIENADQHATTHKSIEPAKT